MAETLAPRGPLPLLSSPLRRCRETAAALAAQWGEEPVIEPGVGEVESPVVELAQRGPWLRAFMAGTWDGQPPELVAWRQRVLDTLLGLDQDTVVVTHFIAINAAVGAATDDRRVVCFAPDNCSRTEMAAEAGSLRVVRLGDVAPTVVQ